MISDFMLAEIRFPWVLIIAVALFLWRKHSKLKEILEGTAKALLGYFMVVIGASVIPVTTAPLSALMQGAFGINGGVMNSEAYSAALLAEFGPAALMVMFCAFAINLLLAKFTRLKGVYLTGHHYLYMSLFAVMILQTRSGLPTHLVVILGAVILGVYGWLTVVATRRVTEKTTGMSGVGMANSSASAALIGAFTARICGRQEDRYEPGDRLYWSNISSIPVGAAICTFVVYVILACFAGFGQAETIFKSGN